MRAGGGASSSKAGGLKEGARSMCIGRWGRFALGPAPLRWAVGGRGRVGRCMAVGGCGWVGGRLLFAAFMALMAGKTTGELRRRAAPGQPQS